MVLMNYLIIDYYGWKVLLDCFSRQQFFYSISKSLIIILLIPFVDAGIGKIFIIF